MRQIRLSDLDFYAIGNEIQIVGAIYEGRGEYFLVPFPDHPEKTIEGRKVSMLVMDSGEYARFLNQSDVLDIPGEKAILRKSQRQIDRVVQWEVFERDGYRCRYCARKVPLTVDHVVLWEDGGASVKENLIAACYRCNKVRGRMQYADWLRSDEYGKVSMPFNPFEQERNLEVLGQLDELRRISVKPRSR